MVDRRAPQENRTNAPIRILIADDHAVLRSGLRVLLDAEPDMQVVGEAEDGAMALARVRELSPDVVLLDLTMPRMGGLEVLRQIGEIAPRTRVLVLTMHDDQGYLREALTAGCAGYVLKRAADIELFSAIRAVHQGGTYLHAAHTRVLFEPPRTRPLHPQAADEPELSPRELEILRLVALGYTSRQAANELNLSAKTVETYRGRLMGKLELRNRVELVRYALQRGLLDD